MRYLSRNPRSRTTRGGCLIRGCALFAVVALILGGFMGWAMYSTYRHLYAVTSPAPRVLPVVHVDAARYEHLEREFAEFAKAARAGQADEIRLTASDLNTLFAHAREVGKFTGNAYYRIVDNQLIVDMSIPLDDISYFEGRWFNGQVVLGLLIESDRLQIEPQRITSGDKEVPMAVVDAMRKFDWTGYLGPQVYGNMGYVKSVSIEDNEVVVRTQPPAKKAAAAAAPN